MSNGPTERVTLERPLSSVIKKYTWQISYITYSGLFSKHLIIMVYHVLYILEGLYNESPNNRNNQTLDYTQWTF